MMISWAYHSALRNTDTPNTNTSTFPHPWPSPWSSPWPSPWSPPLTCKPLGQILSISHKTFSDQQLASRSLHILRKRSFAAMQSWQQEKHSEERERGREREKGREILSLRWSQWMRRIIPRCSFWCLFDVMQWNHVTHFVESTWLIAIEVIARLFVWIATPNKIAIAVWVCHVSPLNRLLSESKEGRTDDK
jgi:hypothetical protein